MTVRTYQKSRVGVVELQGNVKAVEDGANLARAVHKLLVQEAAALVLDLTKVAFITGSVCGFIVASYKKAAKAGIAFDIVVPSNSVAAGVLHVAHVQQIAGIYDSLNTYWACARTDCVQSPA